MPKKQKELPTLERPTIEAIDEKIAKHQKAKEKKAKAELELKVAAEEVSAELIENISKLEKDSEKNHCYVYRDGDEEVEYVIPCIGSMRTRKPTKAKDDEGSID